MDPARKRRILLVSDTWRPNIDGVVRVMEHLERELAARGVEVEVMHPEEYWNVPLPFYREFKLALFSRRSIRNRIRNGSYEEIHILTYGPVALYARAACIRLRKPFTMSFHNQIHLYAEVRFGAWARKPVERLIRWLYAPAQVTMVTTESARRQLEEFGLRRVAVWPLGVDARFFTRKSCPLTLQKPVFVFVGRLAVEKNIEEFLRASLAGTKLVIGDGPDRTALEKKYPSAVFLGYKTGDELIAAMCCADVLVMPSRTETFGLVIVEALALGIPAAAHDEVGPRDIIHSGVNGYLDEDIACAARRCLELSPQACIDSARHYSWSASAERFLELSTTEVSAQVGTSG